jgi:hypothetical protein
MASVWHYSRNGKQHGPVSSSELKSLASSGQLAPTDMVWKEGMGEWKRAGSLKGLFPTALNPQKVLNSPPPLPASLSSNSLMQIVESTAGIRSELQKQAVPRFHRLWQSKIAFFGVLLLILIPFNALLPDREAPFLGKLIILAFLMSQLVAFIGLCFYCGKVLWDKLRAWDEAVQRQVKSDQRKLYLQEKWASNDNDSLEVQFTADNAFLISDGSAGRFLLSGDEPNEIIKLDVIGGHCRELKVVSLSSDQLVVAENNKVTTFRRLGEKQTILGSITNLLSTLGPAAESKGSNGHSASEDERMVTEAESISQQLRYFDCPNCGETGSIENYGPKHRIDCEGCGKWFPIEESLNLRTTPKVVEGRGYFQRLFHGSTIQRSRRQQLTYRANDYQTIVNMEIMKGNHQSAQIWQMKLDAVNREIEQIYE